MTSMDRFLEGCRAAAGAAQPALATRALLRSAVTDPALWARGADFSQADERGVARLFADPTVTVLHVDLAPGFESRIHSHGLWAAIGVYAGEEHNRLFRRQGDGVVETGARSVTVGGVMVLGADAIHAIRNPLDQPLRALHVYGGDLESSWRHRWDTPAGPAAPEGGAIRGRRG